MFTNAQVAALVTTLDARIARIEAALVAGSPAQAIAATPVRTAAEALDKPSKARATCKREGHDKVFAVTPAGSPTGTGFHASWCDAGFEPVA